MDPAETHFLRAYADFRRAICQIVDMPDRTVSLLFQFLNQNNGVLSKGAKERKFGLLTASEIERIEDAYARHLPADAESERKVGRNRIAEAGRQIMITGGYTQSIGLRRIAWPRSCPELWCKSAMVSRSPAILGRLDQAATAGSLRVRSSHLIADWSDGEHLDATLVVASIGKA